MNKVHIATDSTADLPPELINEYGITVVPLKVIFSGCEPLLDGVEIDTVEFYRRLAENREMPATSQPTPAEFAAAYGKLSAKGGKIISIHLSSKLSGTCQSARMAKEMVSGVDIEVIDSKLASMGLGLVVLEAAAAARAGKSKEEILDVINKLIPKIQVFFIVDSLDYLVRGGRIGKAQAFLGTILNIKPLLYLKEGIVNPHEKVRGKTRAIDRLVEIVEETAGNQKIKCSLVHGNDPAGVEQLRQKLAAKLNCDEPVVTGLGAVIGTHVGPGVLGIVFAEL
ncbi:DegV family protein [Pelotomaculum terephthalicicum JT]|uniref:DegV family protein n=1 Tax=Pelotomaculum TaxID=191373 RepID=UPI0009CD87A5|nr:MULTISPECIES: DegV family protein [Pelotomaculum]MCG9969552.1 DegV family protein [Pelotomaculum terephthalicicum JT]OPX86137.1 MAG: Fatty acid-binding protein [Pelotomaculum sp. PtaB.Bin117]OPY59964.1 MAG: Fatty acid-binding protein [Pelotomaculum sp. PtaU1.Bin065]